MDDTRARFLAAVNLTPAQLRAHLRSPESRRVGYRHGAARESVGHASGRRIVSMLQRSKWTPADYAHARKVAGYVARHLAQRPAGDVTLTPWRWSLMNWGHDPLR